MGQKRKIRYRLFSWLPVKKVTPSTEPIDVIIPIIAKDLETLPLCLEGVRHCVEHPIKDIYIVAPDDAAIKEFCSSNNLKFIHEESVLGFGPKDMGMTITFPDGKTINRSGWLFQQFIKLSGNVGTCRHYLCIDADHILIHPHSFLSDDGKTVFYMSYEEVQPYYDNIHKLFPDMQLASLSYVDHKMLFDKQRLATLHQQLEKGGEKPWYQVIMDSYDRSQQSGFSEFELYGNYTPSEEKVLRPWLQKMLRAKDFADYATLQKRWKGKRWSLTFPAYRK